MTNLAVQRVGYGLLFALYPILIYAGLRFFDPRWVACLLLLVIGLRLLSTQFPPALRILWIATTALAAGYTFWTGSEQGVLFYPVVTNIVLLVLFGASWLHPPTIIETLARLQHPDLPESGIRYTRKVTLVWCGFFLVNGTLALITTFLGRDWWLLYNGFIAYVMMGVLFLGEMVVRKRYQAKESSADGSTQNGDRNA